MSLKSPNVHLSDERRWRNSISVQKLNDLRSSEVAGSIAPDVEGGDGMIGGHFTLPTANLDGALADFRIISCRVSFGDDIQLHSKRCQKVCDSILVEICRSEVAGGEAIGSALLGGLPDRIDELSEASWITML